MELSIKTVAIVVLFLIVASIGLLFIFNVYSEATEQGESYTKITEDALEDGISGKFVENIEKINEVTRKMH